MITQGYSQSSGGVVTEVTYVKKIPDYYHRVMENDKYVRGIRARVQIRSKALIEVLPRTQARQRRSP